MRVADSFFMALYGETRWPARPCVTLAVTLVFFFATGSPVVAEGPPSYRQLQEEVSRELDKLASPPEPGVDYLAGLRGIWSRVAHLAVTTVHEDHPAEMCKLADLVRERIITTKDNEHRLRLVEALLAYMGVLFISIERPYPSCLLTLEDFIIELMKTDPYPLIRKKIVQRYHYIGGAAFLEALASVARSDEDDDVRYFAVLDSLWISRRRGEDEQKVRQQQAAVLKEALASADYVRRLATIHALPIAVEEAILSLAEVESLLVGLLEDEKDATLQIEIGLRIATLAARSETLKKLADDIIGQKRGNESLRLGVELGRALTERTKETMSALLYSGDTKKTTAAITSLVAAEEEWAWALLSDFIRGVEYEKKGTPPLGMRKLALYIWLAAYDKQVSKQYENPDQPVAGRWKVTPQLESFSLWLKGKTCQPLFASREIDSGLHFLCVAGLLSHNYLPQEWLGDTGFAKILELAASDDVPIPSKLLFHCYVLTRLANPEYMARAATVFRRLVENISTPQPFKEALVKLYAAGIAAYLPEFKEKARQAFFEPRLEDSALARLADLTLESSAGSTLSYYTWRSLQTFHFDMQQMVLDRIDEKTVDNPLGAVLFELWTKHAFTPEESERIAKTLFGR